MKEPIPLSIKEGKPICHFIAQSSCRFLMSCTWLKNRFGDNLNLPFSLGRGGLGQESELKRKQEIQQKCLHVAREKRMKLEAKQREQFREKQKERFSNKQVEKDLFQSQKACEQLDIERCKLINHFMKTNITLLGNQVEPGQGGQVKCVF